MALTKEDLQAIRALMKEELAPISDRLDRVEESLETVKNSQMKTELVQYPRIAAALDGMKGVKEKFDKLDRVEAVQEDHSHRIWALEQSIKKAL